MLPEVIASRSYKKVPPPPSYRPEQWIMDSARCVADRLEQSLLPSQQYHCTSCRVHELTRLQTPCPFAVRPSPLDLWMSCAGLAEVVFIQCRHDLVCMETLPVVRDCTTVIVRRWIIQTGRKADCDVESSCSSINFKRKMIEVVVCKILI